MDAEPSRGGARGAGRVMSSAAGHALPLLSAAGGVVRLIGPSNRREVRDRAVCHKPPCWGPDGACRQEDRPCSRRVSECRFSGDLLAQLRILYGFLLACRYEY